MKANEYLFELHPDVLWISNFLRLLSDISITSMAIFIGFIEFVLELQDRWMAIYFKYGLGLERDPPAS